jgi:hypothetical protein
MSDLFATVNECLERYIGGTAFFDELDKAVKYDEEMLRQLIMLAKVEYPKAKLIASGEIGLCLHNFHIPIDLIVQGGLRHNPSPLDLAKFTKPNDKYIFVDDSYFSGRTAHVIKESLEKCDCILDGVVVIYDGCYDKRDNVVALYRYYDHHDILGRPLNKEEDNNE